MAGKRTALIVIVVGLLFCPGSAWSKSDEAYVSGLYRVELDSAVMGGDVGRIIGALAASPGVIHRAAKEVYQRDGSALVRLHASDMSSSRDSHLFRAHFAGLPAEGQEKAQLFLRKVAQALEQALSQSFHEGQQRLVMQLDQARVRQQQLDHKLTDAPAPRAATAHVQQQLDTVVDLSELQPEMSAAEAFEVIRNAADPPLNISVIWKALLDQAEVEPATPIDMDGLPTVRLGTGLDMICKALGGGFYRIGFKCQDNVIMVATQETLDRFTPSEPDRTVTSRIYTSSSKLMARCQELVDKQNHLILEVSQMEATQRATEKEIQRLRHDIEQKIKESTADLELETLLNAMEARRTRLDRAISAGRATPDELVDVLQKLAELKLRVAEHRMNLVAHQGGKIQQDLNLRLAELTVDLAGRQAELSTITGQIRQLEHQLETTRLSETQQLARDMDRRALEKVMKRIHELQEQLDQLQAPSVTLVEAVQ